MALFENLQELMVKYRFRPEKKLSQFFCTRSTLLETMVEKANINSNDIVLEIGPGTGFMTRLLLEKSKKVIAIENDKKMIDVLSNEFSSEIKNKHLELIYGDILEVELKKMNITKIVSLPPYHISSKLVNKIILSEIPLSILMLDTGFVEKLTAFEGLKEYTALSAFVNLNADIEILKDNISGENFFPTPNCRNAIVSLKLTPKNTSVEFFHFIKQLFRHKNKDLSRALRQAFPFIERELAIKKENLDEKISDLDLADVKVNLLSPKELCNIYVELTQ
jgi:16S rRNA (adenine1518-N6/adenine1519-N6)-dimethyltransferase